jgi:hypothetical protein
MGPNPCDSGDVRTLRIFFRTTVTWSRIQIRHGPSYTFIRHTYVAHSSANPSHTDLSFADSQHHSALQSQLSGYSESHRNPEVDYCHQVP